VGAVGGILRDDQVGQVQAWSPVEGAGGREATRPEGAGVVAAGGAVVVVGGVIMAPISPAAVPSA
jgi:hypothetical protein